MATAIAASAVGRSRTNIRDLSSRSHFGVALLLHSFRSSGGCVLGSLVSTQANRGDRAKRSARGRRFPCEESGGREQDQSARPDGRGAAPEPARRGAELLRNERPGTPVRDPGPCSRGHSTGDVLRGNGPGTTAPGFRARSSRRHYVSATKPIPANWLADIRSAPRLLPAATGERFDAVGATVCLPRRSIKQGSCARDSRGRAAELSARVGRKRRSAAAVGPPRSGRAIRFATRDRARGIAPRSSCEPARRLCARDSR